MCLCGEATRRHPKTGVGPVPMDSRCTTLQRAETMHQCTRRVAPGPSRSTCGSTWARHHTSIHSPKKKLRRTTPRWRCLCARIPSVQALVSKDTIRPSCCLQGYHPSKQLCARIPSVQAPVSKDTIRPSCCLQGYHPSRQNLQAIPSAASRMKQTT